MTSFTKSSAELQHGLDISLSESGSPALFFPSFPSWLPLHLESQPPHKSSTLLVCSGHPALLTTTYLMKWHQLNSSVAGYFSSQFWRQLIVPRLTIISYIHKSKPVWQLGPYQFSQL